MRTKPLPFRKKPRIKTRFMPDALAEQLSFQVEPETREQLVALAFLRGYRGAYAAMARLMIKRAIKEYIATDLDPDERKEFETILVSVRSSLFVSRMKQQEQRKKSIEERKAYELESETLIPEGGDEEEP